MSLGNIIEQIADIFTGHHDDEEMQNQQGNVLPASQDPLGDPADQQGGFGGFGGFGNVRPASEDPLGDPADQQGGFGGFNNVRPASEDPLGDPADQR